MVLNAPAVERTSPVYGQVNAVQKMKKAMNNPPRRLPLNCELGTDLSEYCIMSPSTRRLQELADYGIDLQREKKSLADIGVPQLIKTTGPIPEDRLQVARALEEKKSPTNNDENSRPSPNPPSLRKKLRLQASKPWGAFREKIGFFFGPEKAVETEDSARRESLMEELQEFLRAPELKMIKFPAYFSRDDEALLRTTSQEMGLFCETNERYIIVYKNSASLTSWKKLKHLQCEVPKPPASNNSTHGDDLIVNIPELAALGQDSFFQELRLRRLDSVGGKRRTMLWEVAQSAKNRTASPVHGGDGGVYALPASDGHNVAMFKPMEEEKFVREGLEPGEGAVREEAAYLIDSSSGGFCGVPPTAVAELHLAKTGKTQKGSVQRFMQSSKGSLEDFAMPTDLTKACEFVPINEIHKVGIFDIRVFNTDRHSGNLLLMGEEAPYALVPIDHGCILPSWFHLAEARFDWADTPQAKSPFSAEMLTNIEKIDAKTEANVLRSFGIREECVTTLRVCTLFLQIAARRGKTLAWMAQYMQRTGCLDKPSEFELLIKKACERSQIPFRFVANQYNEETGMIEPGILSRRPPSRFFDILRELITRACAKK